jgi:hypothetical protein
MRHRENNMASADCAAKQPESHPMSDVGNVQLCDMARNACQISTPSRLELVLAVANTPSALASKRIRSNGTAFEQCDLA